MSTTPPPALTGATCTLHVIPHYAGVMLHRLEYRTDVHVIELGKDNVGAYFKLRSDTFPAEWEGHEVLAVIDGEGIADFTLLAKKKTAAAQAGQRRLGRRP